MANRPQNFFRKCREEAGLTQFQAAVAIGVTPSCISLWETGGTLPQMALFASIAETYRVGIAAIAAEVLRVGLARGKRNKTAAGAA